MDVERPRGLVTVRKSIWASTMPSLSTFPQTRKFHWGRVLASPLKLSPTYNTKESNLPLLPSGDPHSRDRETAIGKMGGRNIKSNHKKRRQCSPKGTMEAANELAEQATVREREQQNCCCRPVLLQRRGLGREKKTSPKFLKYWEKESRIQRKVLTECFPRGLLGRSSFPKIRIGIPLFKWNSSDLTLLS